jgi:hypothetical protein
MRTSIKKLIKSLIFGIVTIPEYFIFSSYKCEQNANLTTTIVN